MHPKRTPSTRATVALVLNRVRLDELRRAHGIQTEADLARVIGVNASTLYRVSNKLTLPSNEFIAQVACAFPSAPLDQLFTVETIEAKAEKVPA
jgi:DNA-binding XRE family transcriptional regulator